MEQAEVSSPGPSAPATTTFISCTPTTFLDNRNDLFSSFVNDSIFSDLTLDLSLMPKFATADSPASSLSTPTTQLSFEDSVFSVSPASSSQLSLPTSLSLDKVTPYFDGFVYANPSPLFDGTVLTSSPFLGVKQEPLFSLNAFDSFGEMSYMPLEYKPPEPIHRSIEVPASPQPLPVSTTFSCIESFERTVPGTIRPFQHSFPTFSSNYTSSSEDAACDLPPPSPLPKKPARVSKQNKGIKCDHCGVDKTPLWRKVPHKENAYHCNACGLYYKSNGHFRSLEGDNRVIRAKKTRRLGDVGVTQSFRSGPVTANRNVTCANCGTNTTVLWRKGPDGQSPLCNPCGLFYKLHGSHRSPEKKKEIHRRNRAGKKRFSISTERTWSSTEEGDDEVESPVESTHNVGYHGSQGQVFVKREEGEFTPSPVSEFSQYPYPWLGQSVQGRC